MGDLKDGIILKTLAASPGGMDVYRLRDAIGGNANIQEITDKLTYLSSQGLVHLVKGHLWRPRGMYPADAIGTQLAVNDIHPSEWSDIRRLCRYYRDCNLLSGSKGMTLWPDREHRQYVQITARLDWAVLEKGESVYLPDSTFAGPLDDTQGEKRGVSPFLLGIQADPQCYFCGPVFTSGATSPVLPVFINPCTAEWLKDQSLVRIALTSLPEINEEWLKSFARNADRRAELQMYFGEEDAASEEALDSVSPRQAFSELYSRLRKLLEGDVNVRKICREIPCLPNSDPPIPLERITQRGFYNRLLLVRQSSAIFTQRLQKELRMVSGATDEELSRSALSIIRPNLVGLATVNTSNTGFAELEPAQVDILSPDQRRACSMALINRLSLVSGPPGTGKSRVVANAMINALLEGQSVLFASRNHQALDAVVPYLNGMCQAGLVVGRLSVPQEQNVEDPLRACLSSLLDCIVQPGAVGAIATATHDVMESRKRLKELKSSLAQTADMYIQASDAMAKAEALLQKTGKAQNDVFELADCLLAELKGLCDGKSPVDWIESLNAEYQVAIKVPEGIVLLRKVRAWFRSRRLRTIDDRWRAMRTTLLEVFARSEVQGIFKTLSLDGCNENHGLVVSDTLDALSRFCLAAEAISDARQRQTLANNRESVETVQESIRDEERRLVSLTRNALLARVQNAGHDMTNKERELMDNLFASLKIGGSQARLQALFRKAFPVLLRFAPLWAVSNLSAGRNLPLTAGLFDLLIIDEASQCDIPSVIPLLYRCRRVMVVGDRKQLSFVAGISKAANYRLRMRHELQDSEPFDRYDFRTRTFFDLVNGLAQTTQKCRVMLRDHYRCDPGIASYFNQAFYKGQLFINTDLQKLKKPDQNPVAIRWHECPADAQRCSTGGAISESHIKVICDELKRLEKSGFSGTVGVVSPFRSQANRIKDRANELFANQFPHHWDFKSSTADGFQGGERDLILLSLVGGPDLPGSCEWFYEADPNRFNVAVSRARSVLQVYGNKDWTQKWASQNPKRSHIGLLAEMASSDTDVPLPLNPDAPRPKSPPIDGNPDLIGPMWEPKFAQALWDAGLPVIKQYLACARSLDIALIREGLKLGIEVDGEAYHRGYDGNRKKEDIERDLILMANGWTIKRFWVYELREKWQQCIDEVLTLWNG